MRLFPVLALSLLLAAGLAGCGSKEDEVPPDSDSDLVQDPTEERGWEISLDRLGHRVKLQVASDPNDPDSDDDGLPDHYELVLGLDARDADSDRDGLSDCQEAYHSVLAQCQAAGRDPERARELEASRDGGTGTDSRNADSDPGQSRYVNNTLGFRDEDGNRIAVPWGDGIADGAELAGYTVTVRGQERHVRTDPRVGDSDGDGIDEGEEAFVYGSDPTVVDTDGDGCMDGRDIFPDRRDRYTPGLSRFTLKTEAAPGSGADVRILLVLYDNITSAPAGQGVFHAAKGDSVNLTALNPPPLRPGSCSAAPFDAWILLQLVATDNQGASRILDITSQSHPGASGGDPGAVWWNPRDGTFAATARGPALPTPVVLSGRDAELSLLPRILFD